MTSQKQLKARVRARMARTGESYTTARRHVAGPAAPVPVEHAGYRLRGGVHPVSAALAAVLAHHGVRAGGGELSEALVFGIAGGPGAGYILWEFAHDDSRVVTVHELAHQWFYAMVGNSQARDPWLDEAFATFAEEEIDGTTAATRGALKLPGKVGDSTTDYGGNEKAYYNTTYGKGAAALIAARDAGPPDKFDAALRCYVNANAWRIAKPADLAAALAGLPASTAVLRQAGALP